MASNCKDHGSPAPSVSVDEILSALDENSDWLTLDEILAAPIADIDAELAGQGLVPTRADEAGLTALAALPPPPEAEESPAPAELLPFPVERPRLIVELHDLVMACAAVVVRGVAGSGKSHFILRQYLRHPAVCADLPRRIVVDCAALRMVSEVSFGREAVWAHFGSDDLGFKAFFADHPFEHDLLIALMNMRLRLGGVVVFDHAECLDQSGPIDSWLNDTFLPSAAELGVKVIFIEGSRAPHPRPALRELAAWSLPEISRADLAAWLECPALKRLRTEGLSAGPVLKMTGGRPGLLRDLGLFLRHYPRHTGAEVLRIFRQWRLRDSHFFADCERLVRAARHHPELLERALAPDGFRRPWPVSKLSAAAARDVLATGAVRQCADGMLHFASPLYFRRLLRLIQPDALARLALRTDFHNLCGAPVKALKRFGELAADPIAKALGREKNPVIALQRLAGFLSRWGPAVSIELRDRDNTRLWAPFDCPEEIGPLECWMRPDFARAAQTGQLVQGDDGCVYLPVIANAGIVGIMLILDFSKRTPWLPRGRQIDIDRIAGVVQGIRPTLAQLVLRLALHRERKLQGKLWFKSKCPDVPPARHGLLREIGCQSIIVFERRASRSWVVSRFERTGDVEDAFRWTEGFSAARLEAIARHPSKRGLVLSGDHVRAVFPRLGSRNAAVFLHPIPRADDAAIVAFLFDGPAVRLDGHVQAKLSGVAPDLLTSAA